LPFTLLTSLRYYCGGTLPVTNGWPFRRTTLTVDGISIRPAWRRSQSHKGALVCAKWADLARIERTRGGIRLIFIDARQPVVVATLWKAERLQLVVQRFCPVEYDPTLRPGTWSSI
jgi:hypothetical protein